MIFVTVGSVFPFDRLVRAMDHWASLNPGEHVIAQIGSGGYKPTHMEWTEKISPGDFRTKVRDASVVVSHAGMGTVITAAEFGRPIVLLPRRADLVEHTTDHQLHTADWLKSKPGIFLSESEGDLDRMISGARAPSADHHWSLSTLAPVSLAEQIRKFIHDDRLRPSLS